MDLQAENERLRVENAKLKRYIQSMLDSDDKPAVKPAVKPAGTLEAAGKDFRTVDLEPLRDFALHLNEVGKHMTERQWRVILEAIQHYDSEFIRQVLRGGIAAGWRSLKPIYFEDALRTHISKRKPTDGRPQAAQYTSRGRAGKPEDC